MIKVVLASGNTGKLREFSELCSTRGIDLIPQHTLGVSEVDEPHCTFLENALAKARHASRCTGLPALADDSGLCVNALNGAPGVYSARYGQQPGQPRSDLQNNLKLLQALAETKNRRAYYFAALVLVRYADDPQPLIGEGLCWGEIATEPVGSQGFGYDPVFFLPQLGRTAAQLSLAEKSGISHRALALDQLLSRWSKFQAQSVQAPKDMQAPQVVQPPNTPEDIFSEQIRG